LSTAVWDIVAEGDIVAVRSIKAGTLAHALATWNAPDTGRLMELKVRRGLPHRLRQDRRGTSPAR
jgi:hypothetical protein